VHREASAAAVVHAGLHVRHVRQKKFHLLQPIDGTDSWSVLCNKKNQSTQKLRETGSLRDGALLDHESVLQDYDDTYMDTEITTTIPLLTVNFSQPRVLVIHWFRL
jgi:hypothetical protein